MIHTQLKIIVACLIFLSLSCSNQPVAPGGIQPMGLMNEPCRDGETRSGYLQPMTTGDFACPTATQMCMNGRWQGPELYSTCESHTKSCDGSPHGTVVTGYLQPQTQKGVPCPTATKTCLNGVWVGPIVYTSCVEL